MTRTARFLTHRAALVLTAASAGLLGCEAAPEASADAEPQTELEQQANFISVSGSVKDIVSGRSLNSAQICMHSDYESPCAYSDAKGQFTLDGVPANRNVALEITREYFQSVLVPVSTTLADEAWSVELASELVMGVQARRAGVSLDDDAGHLAIRVNEVSDGSRFVDGSDGPGTINDGPSLGEGPVVAFIPSPPSFQGKLRPATDARVLRWYRGPDGELRRQRPGPKGAYDLVPHELPQGFDVEQVPTEGPRLAETVPAFERNDRIDLGGLRDNPNVITPTVGMQGLTVQTIMADGEVASYTNSDGLVDKAQDRTSSNGSAMVFNMRAGLRMAYVSPSIGDLACTPDFGWTYANNDRVVIFPTEPGFATYVTMDCARQQ